MFGSQNGISSLKLMYSQLNIFSTMRFGSVGRPGPMYVCWVGFCLNRCSSSMLVSVSFRLGWVDGGFSCPDILGMVGGALFLLGLPTVAPELKGEV